MTNCRPVFWAGLVLVFLAGVESAEFHAENEGEHDNRERRPESAPLAPPAESITGQACTEQAGEASGPIQGARQPAACQAPGSCELVRMSLSMPHNTNKLA